MGNLVNRISVILSCAAGAVFIIGCSSTPADDKGADGTTAYYIRVQTSREGISIETNNVFAGKSPLTIKLFGDKDGTFHNFGAPQYVVRALPESTNHFIPTQAFRTGNKSSPGDRVPGMIFFDMDSASGSFSVDTFPDK
jgi:hypothetical protein